MRSASDSCLHEALKVIVSSRKGETSVFPSLCVKIEVFLSIKTFKMANCFTIGQYQYNIHYESEESLHLKAINYDSLVDYRCDVDMESIKENSIR